MNNRSNDVLQLWRRFLSKYTVINLRGLRNTKKRIEILELFKILNRKLYWILERMLGQYHIPVLFFKCVLGLS